MGVAVYSEKIMPLGELGKKLDSLRREGKTIVHCHGVFDLLHIGHIRHFEQARSMGDVLVVTLTPDRYVDKGPDRPAFPERLRCEALASLHCTDYVAVNEWPTAEETLRLLRPHFYVKGSEFKNTSSDVTGKIGREERVAAELGIQLAFTDDIVFSSSNLINRYLADFPDELTDYLHLFRGRYSSEQLFDIIGNMADARVLVVGDAIVDEYQYCDALGKSSKDPVLAMKYLSHESFAGGALAVANHVAGFAKSVDVLTGLGERHSYEGFIRSSLSEAVVPHFIMTPAGHTIVKRRFVDRHALTKLFKIYVMDDNGLPADENRESCEWLRQNLSDYDLVVAADFGNGFVTAEMIDTICESGRFLSAMTQANAANRGFHTITRYRRADYVCLAEHEIRLEMRDNSGRLRPMIDLLAKKLDCSRFVVTRGRRGCLSWAAGEAFVEVPALSQRVVDRVGAGDAFFSVSSLAALQGVPSELIGFMGNVAGCLTVRVMGNAQAVDKTAAIKHIRTLMK